jgi:hypothetical protein
MKQCPPPSLIIKDSVQSYIIKQVAVSMDKSMCINWK